MAQAAGILPNVKQESDSALPIHPPRSGGWMGGDDCLKMNYVQMKTTEIIKLLRHVGNEDNTMPLSDAEQRLYAALHLARMGYEDEIRLGHPAPERLCMICGVPVSDCCC